MATLSCSLLAAMGERHLLLNSIQHIADPGKTGLTYGSPNVDLLFGFVQWSE